MAKNEPIFPINGRRQNPSRRWISRPSKRAPGKRPVNSVNTVLAERKCTYIFANTVPSTSVPVGMAQLAFSQLAPELLYKYILELCVFFSPK